MQKAHFLVTLSLPDLGAFTGEQKPGQRHLSGGDCSSLTCHTSPSQFCVGMAKYSQKRWCKEFIFNVVRLPGKRPTCESRSGIMSENGGALP